MRREIDLNATAPSVLCHRPVRRHLRVGVVILVVAVDAPSSSWINATSPRVDFPYDRPRPVGKFVLDQT